MINSIVIRNDKGSCINSINGVDRNMIKTNGLALAQTGSTIEVKFTVSRVPYKKLIGALVYGMKSLSIVETTIDGWSVCNISPLVSQEVVLRFIMPDEDVEIIITTKEEYNTEIVKKQQKMKEGTKMDNNITQTQNGIIDYFEIPEELAKELSELLTKQVVRERLLMQVINDPVKYEEMEKMILPITTKVEAIKIKITNVYVPEKYRSTQYMWNYDGWEVDKNKVQILNQQ